MRARRLSLCVALALSGLALTGLAGFAPAAAAAKKVIRYPICVQLGEFEKNGKTFFGVRCVNPNGGACYCSAYYCNGGVTNVTCMPLIALKNP